MLGIVLRMSGCPILRAFAKGGIYGRLPPVEPRGVNRYRKRLAEGVVPKTTPLPILGLFYQASCDRVLMEVSKLFDALTFGPHVEVIEPALPEAFYMLLAGRHFS